MTTILITIGHGMQPNGKMDKGAYDAETKTSEYDINKLMVEKVVAALEAYNVTIVTDAALFGRASDPNWAGIVKYVNNSNVKYDLLLEIHHDSANAPDVGFGIAPKRLLAFADKSMQLARSIENAYGLYGMRSKKSYYDVRGLGLLRIKKTPVLIWECGRTTDVPNYYVTQRSNALAMGIVNYLKLVKITSPTVEAAPLPLNIKYMSLLLNKVFTDLPKDSGSDAILSRLVSWKKERGYFASTVLTMTHLKIMAEEANVNIEDFLRNN